MKKFKASSIVVIAVCLWSTANATDANPVAMVNEVGFLGCDAIVAETFEYAMRAQERRFSVDYFDENARSSVNITGTYGSTGDTIWQTAHFERRGEYCYSVVRALIFDVGNCAGLLSKDQNFKYTADSAGALWSKNKGGVNKIFIQSGNSCSQIFVNSNKKKITK